MPVKIERQKNAQEVFNRNLKTRCQYYKGIQQLDGEETCEKQPLLVISV